MPEPDEQRARREGCDLSGIRQLADLPPETRAELQGFCRLRSFSAGETIVHAGETPEFIGCVHKGILRMQKTLYDGRQHIVGLLVGGDMFGRVFNGPLEVDIEAATDAEVCAFRRAPFEALLSQSPELDRVVLLNILNELDRARDWMIILANNKVTGRLAGFLLFLCSRFVNIDHFLRVKDGELDVQIPLGRADVAHLLGTRRESISRAFRALAEDGTIIIRRPDLIRILDLDALATEMGAEEPGDHVSLKQLVQALQERDGDAERP